MKALVVALALSFTSTFALADSFSCDSSAENHLQITVQNNVDPTVGTRTAKLLTVADSQAPTPSKYLISATQILQNGAFWTIDTTIYAQANSAQIGDFDRKVVTQVQVYIPSFDYNDANKDGQHNVGYLLLYKNGNTEAPVQSIELECVYSWQKSN